MSQYNKTVLTRAGLELAKRANAGQAKFGITRAVTSADDWSHKTVQDLEAVTTIPNIMQQGTIMDANEVESNNSVIGVSLCFTNKNLSTGYQIRIIGLYVKEEGQENDFLYAVTTAITPEYMPSFADKVLYRFNMQMYCVIGKAQAVNVVIDDGTAVTHGQFDKYKDEINKSIEAVAEAHTEDMKKVVKSATINGGAKVTPDGDGNLALVVPDPDLSDLAHKSELVPKADKTYVDDKVDAIDFSRIKFRKQYVNSDGQPADKTWSATKNKDGTYTIDLWQDDWTASKLYGVLAQLPNKADTSTVNAQIADVKNTGKQAQATADSALAGYNKRPVISGGASDDLLSFKTTQLRYYPGNGNTCKNLPPATNQQWFTVEYIFENPNGDGIAIYRSPANEIWTIGNNGGYYDQGWVKVANANDIQGLQNQVNTKLASGDLPTELQKITFRKQYVDGSNKLQDGHWKLVKQADGSYLVDLYHDDWTAQRVAYLLNQIGSKADISDLQNIINQQNQTIQSLTTRLANAENEIRYIKANYVEGRTFPASQEAQANSWENANPQRIAFIEK